MSRTSTLPKRLQPMLATLTDAPFDDKKWVFEDKYDGFRMVAKTQGGKVTLYSRNGKIISHSYIEVAEALEDVKGDAVIDGELVALDGGHRPDRLARRSRVVDADDHPVRGVEELRLQHDHLPRGAAGDPRRFVRSRAH